MPEPANNQTQQPTEDIEIKQFLEGHNPLKYVVGIETYYDKNYADLIIHNKDTGVKEIRKHIYKPFVYIKDFKKAGVKFFDDDRTQLRKAMNKYNIKIEKLRVTDNNGAVVDRLDNGYKYMVSTTSGMGWRAIQNFFREGGVDLWKKERKQATFALKKPEVLSNGLYTFLEQKNGVQLYWNNKDSRFEAHFVNNFISTYRENKDDDENGTFISVKGGSNTLVYNKEFSMYHYKERNKYVIILNPTKQDESEDIAKCHPALAHLKDPAEYDEHIAHLKEKGEWAKADAALHKKLVTAYEKKLAALASTGGVNYSKATFVYNTSFSDLFFKLKNEEQFMISTGIRLFKGFETYDELEKVTFDIETEGLVPKDDQIFKIGIRHNHTKSHILTVKKLGDPEEEKGIIVRFFKALRHFNPAIISGYHSENFDFWFILERAKILGLDINELDTTLRPAEHKIKRKEGASLKLGGEVEHYTQTIMWGYTVLDILHAVRRTQAINSDIKEAGLKWICKYEKISKPDRVYIKGDNIMKYWKEDKWFAVFPETNEYKELPEELQALDGDIADDVLHSFFGETTELRRGSWLVDRYLEADLWETEQVDERYNVDRFMVGKYMPTSFHRTCTMGGAAQWNLIMTAWSYEKGLAIPHRVTKHAFTGGLSRTFMLGKFENVYKFDYSGLYPSLQLEFKIFPKHDVTNVLERLLRYFKVTRDVFKSMARDESLDERTRMIAGTKQLPLKILNNSNFGANGSEVFNWSDFVCAERITCMGRLYLRRMIQFFQKYGCVPTVCDSVTGETPVYIKHPDGKIDIVPIEDLFNKDTPFIDEEKLRDYSEKPYKILTQNGWKDIKYVYRHGTDKQIHEILTKDRMVQVTEDHSLFQNGFEITPKDLVRGAKIDVVNINDYHKSNNDVCGVTQEQAYLFGFFAGDGHASCGVKKLKYFAKRKNETVTYNTKRYDFKLSNSNKEVLDGMLRIVNKYYPGVVASVKDHLTSSGVYNLTVYNKEFVKWFRDKFYTINGFKKVPAFILNAPLDIQKSFIDGFFLADGYGNDMETIHSFSQKSQTIMAGLSYLFTQMGESYKVSTRSDKRDIRYSFPLGRARQSPVATKMKTDEVWFNKKVKNRDKDGYVYDVSTEDGTFVGGLGCILLHNTDGINMVVPEMVSVDIHGNPLPEPIPIDTFIYEFIKKDRVVVEKGANALVEKFNVEVLGGHYMKLDNDGMWPSAINISRKNYANMEAPDKNGKVKIKYVGNTLKDKTMPEYVKEFIDKGITLLLENKPMEFVEYYYNYLGEIESQEIPLRKIANKARVKMTPEEYKNRGTDKNGRAKGKQAHMELVIQDGLKVSRGDTLFYVNNGNKKSHSYTTLDKSNGKYMSYIISASDLENDPDKLGEYNIAKYVDTFNKRVSSIITPFCPAVRETLIKTSIADREYYTEKECYLEMYQNPNPKDNINNFFTLEPSEVAFWNRTGLDPYIVLPEFTTDGVYDGYEYQVKYKKVKEVMERDGFSVKTPFDRYVNGDAVVTFELKWFAVNPETNDTVIVPDKYTKILDLSEGYEYPLDEDDYQEFAKYVEAFGEATKLKKVKEFYINVVKEGDLVKVRQI
jgi:DNA polymerase elongation subunit (family B)